jgi:ferredoxin
MAYKMIIDLSKCDGAGDCVDACPSELFTLVEKDGKKYAVFDNDKWEDCTECEVCISSCPQEAISIAP